jgi:EAL domain-containing protein (putative c-di-GMP-specific phosphodiesterase class I)
VETPDQLAGARAAGCAYGQGNLIAAPMPGDRVIDWLIGHQPPPGKTHTG